MLEIANKLAWVVNGKVVDKDNGKIYVIQGEDNRTLATIHDKEDSLFFGISVFRTDDKEHNDIHHELFRIFKNDIFKTSTQQINKIVYHDMDEVEEVEIKKRKVKYCYGYSLIWFSIEKEKTKERKKEKVSQ